MVEHRAKEGTYQVMKNLGQKVVYENCIDQQHYHDRFTRRPSRDRSRPRRPSWTD